MPYGAYEYHFGRVSQLKDSEGKKTGTFRVGPVTTFKKYKGARAATIGHVIAMLKRMKDINEVTVSLYGHWYPEREVFEWKAFLRFRDDLITQLERHQFQLHTMEEAVFDIFDLDNKPPLILAWEAKGHG